MPALILLATADPRLASGWEKQIPAGWPSVRLDSPDWPASLGRGAPGVLVADAASRGRIAKALLRLPTVWVGEVAPGAEGQGVVWTAEASLLRLGEILPLLDRLAEQQAVNELLTERARRAAAAPPAAAPAESLEAAAVWELVEGAWEQLDRRELLLAEFRRAARALLHAGEARFFLTDGSVFRADRGAAWLAADDPVVRHLESQPGPVDADFWGPGSEAAGELAVRTRMAQWGARLLAPVQEGGRLLGWMALGPRRDGKPYGESDRAQAGRISRLLGRALGRAAPPAGAADDHALLREVGLTLAHELGNALVPLSALRQWEGDAVPGPVLAAARHEIAELEQLHREVGRLQELDAYPFESIDLRELVAEIGRELSCPAEVGPEPMEFAVAIPLIRFALRTLAAAASARPMLQLRGAPATGTAYVLVSVRGAEMELAGLLPETQRPGVPNQGRVAVFLAKEIIRLHGGEIRRGPGPAGSELMIELRSRR